MSREAERSKSRPAMPAVSAATTDELDYLLGTGDVELERLAYQHRVWAEDTARLWRVARWGPRQALADLGAGPGFCSVDLAYLVGAEGSVLAVDESRRFLDHLEQEAARLGLNQVQTRRADVTRVPLPEASLDGVFLRWVLCYLPDPAAVLARAAAGLAPGGRLVLLDYFNYRATCFGPRGPALSRVLAAVHHSYRKSGGDLDVGERLPGLVEASGLRVEHLAQAGRLARPGEPFWEWPKRFLFGYVPRLTEIGVLSHAESEAFEREWHERERTPGAFLMTPPMLELVAVKPR